MSQQLENKANWFKPSGAQFIVLFTTSFDLPNHTSIQVFQFKISVKTKRRKQIRFDKQSFFRNFNPIRRLRVARTCFTGPLEYKSCVTFVLLLGVI